MGRVVRRGGGIVGIGVGVDLTLFRGRYLRLLQHPGLISGFPELEMETEIESVANG